MVAKLSLEILKEVQGKSFEMERFEVAYIKNDEGKLQRVNEAELKDFIK